MALGGIYHFHDYRENPDTIQVLLEYGTGDKKFLTTYATCLSNSTGTSCQVQGKRGTLEFEKNFRVTGEGVKSADAFKGTRDIPGKEATERTHDELASVRAQSRCQGAVRGPRGRIRPLRRVHHEQRRTLVRPAYGVRPGQADDQACVNRFTETDQTAWGRRFEHKQVPGLRPLNLIGIPNHALARGATLCSVTCGAKQASPNQGGSKLPHSKEI